MDDVLKLEDIAKWRTLRNPHSGKYVLTNQPDPEPYPASNVRELRAFDGVLVLKMEPLAGGRTGIDIPQKWAFTTEQLTQLRDQINARLEELT